MSKTFIPVPETLFRGKRCLRIALVGLPNSGKSTLFNTVASTAVQTGELQGTHKAYGECRVQIGLDEADLIDLPSIHSLLDQAGDDRATLKYLLWGNEQPPIFVSISVIVALVISGIVRVVLETSNYFIN